MLLRIQNDMAGSKINSDTDGKIFFNHREHLVKFPSTLRQKTIWKCRHKNFITFFRFRFRGQSGDHGYCRIFVQVLKIYLSAFPYRQHRQVAERNSSVCQSLPPFSSVSMAIL